MEFDFLKFLCIIYQNAGVSHVRSNRFLLDRFGMMEDFDRRPSIKGRLNGIHWLPAGMISVFFSFFNLSVFFLRLLSNWLLLFLLIIFEKKRDIQYLANI